MSGTQPLPDAYENYTPVTPFIIDGNALWEVYGIIVQRSEGIGDIPKRKPTMAVDWEDAHGEAIDLTSVYFESKEIKLNCWMMATTKLELQEKFQTFTNAIMTAGIHRLHIGIDPNSLKPLIYQFYVDDKITVKKDWYDQVYCYEFNLNLREPDPVKRIYRYAASNVSIRATLTTSKPVNIFWGDGTADYNVVGTSKTVDHVYGSLGTYFILVNGEIDSITSLTFNRTVTLQWTRLI